MYADDIVIYYTYRDIDRIVDVMNSETDKFKQWVYNKRLTVNPKKTEFMWFASKQRLKCCPDTAILSLSRSYFG